MAGHASRRKVSKMKSRIIWCLSISFMILLSVYCVSALSIKRNSIDDLQKTPQFGKFLPNVGKQNIIYEYNPRYRFLDAKFDCDTNIFMNICVAKKLSMLFYESGFEREGLVTKNHFFTPKGTRVWCAWGMLNPPTRFTLHLFFEPPDPNSSSSNGVMFLHVR